MDTWPSSSNAILMIFGDLTVLSKLLFRLDITCLRFDIFAFKLRNEYIAKNET